MLPKIRVIVGNAFELLKGHKNECGDFQFTTKAGTIGEIIFNFFSTLLFELIIDGPPIKRLDYTTFFRASSGNFNTHRIIDSITGPIRWT